MKISISNPRLFYFSFPNKENFNYEINLDFCKGNFKVITLLKSKTYKLTSIGFGLGEDKLVWLDFKTQ